MMIPGGDHVRNVFISLVLEGFQKGRLNREFGVGGCMVLNLLILHWFYKHYGANA